MKKLILSLALVLPLLATAQESAKEFGFINVSEVFQAMPATQEAYKKLDQLSKNLEDELQAMQEEYQRKGTDYMAQRDTLPESIRLRREAEITDIQEKLKEFYQTAQAEIQQKQQQLVMPIMETIKQAIEQVGDEMGLVYIMDISAEAQTPLVYHSASKCVDVTEAVRKKLNIK